MECAQLHSQSHRGWVVDPNAEAPDHQSSLHLAPLAARVADQAAEAGKLHVGEGELQAQEPLSLNGVGQLSQVLEGLVYIVRCGTGLRCQGHCRPQSLHFRAARIAGARNASSACARELLVLEHGCPLALGGEDALLEVGDCDLLARGNLLHRV